MNEVETLKQMASTAGLGMHEATRSEPIGDVTDWVLRDIRQTAPRQERRDARALATIGCVLVMLAIGMAAQAWSSLGDPMDDMAFQAASVIANPLTEANTFFTEGNQ